MSYGPIETFALLFEPGFTLDPVVVVFTAGRVFLAFRFDDPVTRVMRHRYSYDDPRGAYFDLIKNTALHDKIQPIWGLTEERGELA